MRFAIAAVAVVTLAGVSAASAATEWGKIGPFAVGMSQQAVYYRYGYGGGSPHSRSGFAAYRWRDGRIGVGFFQGHIQQVWCNNSPLPYGSTCPTGFALPDGVKLGASIPFGKTWHGYARCLLDPVASPRWVKYVRDPGGRDLQVTLTARRGRVISIDYWEHVGCGA